MEITKNIVQHVEDGKTYYIDYGSAILITFDEIPIEQDCLVYDTDKPMSDIVIR